MRWLPAWLMYEVVLNVALDLLMFSRAKLERPLESAYNSFSSISEIFFYNLEKKTLIK